jgi:hypothetical protein
MQEFSRFLKLSESESRLVWLPEEGVGFYPVTNLSNIYDERYFKKYLGYEGTQLDLAINEFRIGLINKYIGGGRLIDVGIGSGSLIKSRRNTLGFDINPVAVDWLVRSDLFFDPRIEGAADSISFFDSLEHILDFTLFINRRKFVFVSLPIFTCVEHVLKSKHYRKNEHYWYWTADGLVSMFDRFGYRILERSSFESTLGRDDIQTFVFGGLGE